MVLLVTIPGSNTIYRAHIFTSSGTFQYRTIGDSLLDYSLVIGSRCRWWRWWSNAGGGGGAGGLEISISGHPLAQITITVISGAWLSCDSWCWRWGNNVSDNGSGGDLLYLDQCQCHCQVVVVVEEEDLGILLVDCSCWWMVVEWDWRPLDLDHIQVHQNPNPFRMGYDGGDGTDNGSDNIAAGGGGGAAWSNVENNGTASNGPAGVHGGDGSPTGVGATGPSSPYGQWWLAGGGGRR